MREREREISSIYVLFVASQNFPLMSGYEPVLSLSHCFGKRCMQS